MSVAKARELRKALTSQEVKLWVRLREWRSQGHHIRRQVPIDLYILDFASKRARLAIEVDGGQHGQRPAVIHDELRDDRLEDLGWRVVRFWNREIDFEMPMVLDTIWAGLNDPSYEFRRRIDR